MPRGSKQLRNQGWSDVGMELDWMRHSQEGGILGLEEMDGADFCKKQTQLAGDEPAKPTGKKQKGEAARKEGAAERPAIPVPVAAKPGKAAKRAEAAASARDEPTAEAPAKRRKKPSAGADGAADPPPPSGPRAPAAREVEDVSLALQPERPSKLSTMDAGKAAAHREKLQLRRERMRAKKRLQSEARRAEEARQGQVRATSPRQERAAASDDGVEELAGATAAPSAAGKPPTAKAAKAAKAERKRKGADAPPPPAAPDGALDAAPSAAPAVPCDVGAWAPLELHSDLLVALAHVGFCAPTPIQSACVPAALLHGKDVIGAAETGSGKTLAFGLPIIDHLLREASAAGGPASVPARYAPVALCLLPTRELALQVEVHLSALLPREPAFRAISLVGGMAVAKQRRMLARRPAVVVATPGRLWALLTQYSDEYLSRLHHLRFLVLDEADRMVAPGHFAELSAILDAVEAVGLGDGGALGSEAGVGAAEPPGSAAAALGEGWIEEEGEEEEGEEEEGEEEEEEGGSGAGGRASAAPRAGEPEPARAGRQTFLFSATLTLPAEMRRKRGGAALPAGKGGKGGKVGKGAKGAAAAAAGALVEGSEGNPAMLQLVQRIIFKNPIEVVDLSRRALTVESLKQRRLSCLPEDKEATLWALIRSLSPRRGIVFANSIATVRRLGALLPLLEVPTITLHASMQQRQRLSHLDRFKRTEGGVLLATDVAARGLDIRGLDYVIHFHMPYTVEAYVHRSGRTARAHAEGVCIALVEPNDEKRYRMICHGLGPENAAGFAQYDELGSVADVMPRVHRAISLAMKLDAELHTARKKRANSDWLERAAREMDLELDDELREEVEQSRGAAVPKGEQQRVRDELRRLVQNLSRPTSVQRAAAPHGVRLPALQRR